MPPLPDHIYCTLVAKSGLKKSGKIVSLMPQMCHFHCRQTLRASACSVLGHIKQKAMDYSVLGIDEGQFVSYYIMLTNLLCPPTVL